MNLEFGIWKIIDAGSLSVTYFPFVEKKSPIHKPCFSLLLLQVFTERIEFHPGLDHFEIACKMSDGLAVNSEEKDMIDSSLSSSGDQKPQIHHERNRCFLGLIIITSLLLIWGVSLLPTIFYANTRPAPVGPHVNTR